jgi:adenine-specific DNA-methyltransferase
VANAKYKQKTTKELKINEAFSKDFDNAQNMILKGDNLDSLKILKSHYNGKIKCIYIDPPYNTNGDQFIYPDKFDKEEAEVLGLANISEADYDRMQFSFSTKKSHNGWLAFMYPRLMLARDLLAKDGVIFISIDDNEQANLKLLCDEIFGEENFIGQWNWFKSATPPNLSKKIKKNVEYILCYQKGSNNDYFKGILKNSKSDDPFTKPQNSIKKLTFPPNSINAKLDDGVYKAGVYGTEKFPNELLEDLIIKNGKNENSGVFSNKFIWLQSKLDEELLNGTRISLSKNLVLSYKKAEYGEEVPPNLIDESVNVDTTENAGRELTKLFDNQEVFDYPKPTSLIKYLTNMLVNSDDIILDFFAGSGTTGDAIMQLNAEDGGNRKFILCQIDEPIDKIKKKEAFNFCVENNLPPFISSITCERVKRAGEKINVGDTGFKVFDTTDAPKLEIDENGQITMQNTENDPLSRIYSMIFSVGIDNPTTTPKCVLENCLYKIDNNYYITNAEELDKPENKHLLAEAIKNGRVYIDGWTASINTTLQEYKEDVKILI